MRLKFENYDGKFRICSVVKEPDLLKRKLEQGQNVLYIENRKAFLYPQGTVLYLEERERDHLDLLNNNDVIEISDQGLVFRIYNDCSSDNLLFVTGKCNSNCVMCPSPEYSRIHSEFPDLERLKLQAEYLPSDAFHLTITGGEPFLAGKGIFPLLESMKEKFSGTEFLILTNGRVFCLKDYADLLARSVPEETTLAIPVHASNAKLHDQITMTDGSFEQTRRGIRHLLERQISVELRIVVSALNRHDLEDLGRLIVKEFQGIKYVSIIAMEMTGSALVNKEQVWVSYKDCAKDVKKLTEILLEGGIDTRLYNFPLCTVDPACRLLCKKSISENKVRFSQKCGSCVLKESCSGVFAGTLALEEGELKPIYETELL